MTNCRWFIDGIVNPDNIIRPCTCRGDNTENENKRGQKKGKEKG
jgi:hypothetical protein